MPTLIIPPLMRNLTDGEVRVQVAARTVRDAVAALEARFPGVETRLCAGNRLTPELAVVVNGRLSRLGLFQPVAEGDEVRFVPAIEGG